MHFKYIGKSEVVMLNVSKYFLAPYHSLCSEDRLLNIQDFPIGIIFGDRDFFGSEGAD